MTDVLNRWLKTFWARQYLFRMDDGFIRIKRRPEERPDIEFSGGESYILPYLQQMEDPASQQNNARPHTTRVSLYRFKEGHFNVLQ